MSVIPPAAPKSLRILPVIWPASPVLGVLSVRSKAKTIAFWLATFLNKPISESSQVPEVVIREVYTTGGRGCPWRGDKHVFEAERGKGVVVQLFRYPTRKCDSIPTIHIRNRTVEIVTACMIRIS